MKFSTALAFICIVASTAAHLGVEKAPVIEFATALDAFIYLFPLKKSYEAEYKTGGSYNTFRHDRQLTNASSALIVSPNTDTLYSSAWLDLTDGPLYLHVPDTKGRYYVLEFLDYYQNAFTSVGHRNTGTEATCFLVRGPGQRDVTCDACKEMIDAPTPLVWIVGRTLVDGESDLPAVWAVQDGYIISTTPPCENDIMNPPPIKSEAHERDEMKEPFVPSPSTPLLDYVNYFVEVAAKYRKCPPPENQRLEKFLLASIGITLNKDFDPFTLPFTQRLVLAAAAKNGYSLIKKAEGMSSVTMESNNGWHYTTHIGSYGRDYLTRAVISDKFIAANAPEDALYFLREQDSTNQPLSSGRYVIKVASQPIPARAFWSITLYNQSSFFFVDNPINRYAIRDRTEGLVRDEDGGFTIYIQPDAPSTPV
eukprot:Colp12_sorted_trinity150504_noHs@5080